MGASIWEVSSIHIKQSNLQHDSKNLCVSGTFNFMIVFQAEQNMVMHPFHMLNIAGVFGGSLFSAIVPWVTSSLIRETRQLTVPHDKVGCKASLSRFLAWENN